MTTDTRGFLVRQRWPLAIALVVLIAAAVALVLLSGDAAARERIRVVKAFSDPQVAADLTMGDLLGNHPFLAHQRWDGTWSGDEHLVAVEVDIARFDTMEEALRAPFAAHVARVPQWAEPAGDRPLTVRVVFRVDPAATPPVRPLRVDLTRAWVVLRPEQVEAQESAFARARASSGDPSSAARYRLVRDGQRTLFDAGVHEPSLAGEGLPLAPRAWLKALAKWM